MSDIVTRLRQTRADMIGTDDEQHYWDCHDAAAEIERLRLAWIPVTERLPPDGVRVLAYRNRCDYGFRRDGQWIDTLYGGVLGNGPTHWMPLPAPPADSK